MINDYCFSGIVASTFEEAAKRLISLMSNYDLLSLHVWDKNGEVNTTTFTEDANFEDTKDILEFDFNEADGVSCLFRVMFDGNHTNMTLSVRRLACTAIEGQIYMSNLIKLSSISRVFQLLGDITTKWVNELHCAFLGIAHEDEQLSRIDDEVSLPSLLIAFPSPLLNDNFDELKKHTVSTETIDNVTIFWIQTSNDFLTNKPLTENSRLVIKLQLIRIIAMSKSG